MTVLLPSAVRARPPCETAAAVRSSPVPAGQAELVRVAAGVVRDLNRARPSIYWLDLLASVCVGYAALLLAMFGESVGLRIAMGIVAVLALYRAESFIHELTHLKPGAVPGFRLGWNLAVGVPLMTPSFMYEGVHRLHHSRSRYGTDRDPEYLPPALVRPWALAAFAAASTLAPAALLLRFAVLAPASILAPPLRRWVVERGSSLAINPAFRREPPQGAARRSWRVWEAATSVWAIGLVAATATGVLPLGALLSFLAVGAGVAVVNQVRTLGAHLWESDGEAMSADAQYLDSVTVPPPGWLPALWAPVGLRYHALHHLLPGLPYHALGEAHRRLTDALPVELGYARAHHPSLAALIWRLGSRAGPRRSQPSTPTPDADLA